jgi:hypothetical protein
MLQGGYSKQANQEAYKLWLRPYRAFIAYLPVLSILLTACFVTDWRKNNRKRLKYLVGRGFYVPNMPELADCEFASDLAKGNTDTLILYAHP